MRPRHQWTPGKSAERAGTALSLISAAVTVAILATAARTATPTIAMLYGATVVPLLIGVITSLARWKYPVRRRPGAPRWIKHHDERLGWRRPLAWAALAGTAIWVTAGIFAMAADARRNAQQAQLRSQLDAEMKVMWRAADAVGQWVKDHPSSTPEDQATFKALLADSATHTGNVTRLTPLAYALPPRNVAVWPATLALAFPLAWVALFIWSRQVQIWRYDNGLCVRCGYDLRASSERCPECGEPVPPDRIRPGA